MADHKKILENEALNHMLYVKTKRYIQFIMVFFVFQITGIWLTLCLFPVGEFFQKELSNNEPIGDWSAREASNILWGTGFSLLSVGLSVRGIYQITKRR